MQLCLLNYHYHHDTTLYFFSNLIMRWGVTKGLDLFHRMPQPWGGADDERRRPLKRTLRL